MNSQNLNPKSPHLEAFPPSPTSPGKRRTAASVGGVLELPPGYKKSDKKLPLVVAIHGGPTTASHGRPRVSIRTTGRLYFSAHGYAVLCPNYRGSTGYGDKFRHRPHRPRKTDIEVKDILAGIQHLIDEGIADPRPHRRHGLVERRLSHQLPDLAEGFADQVSRAGGRAGAGIVDTVGRVGVQRRAGVPAGVQEGAAVGDAGDLQEGRRRRISWAM